MKMAETTSIAVAGGAIAITLINVLISKGILTQEEAADIGYRAQNLFGANTSAEAADASRMIHDLLVGPAT
jgi:hypothetical protein